MQKELYDGLNRALADDGLPPLGRPGMSAHSYGAVIAYLTWRSNRSNDTLEEGEKMRAALLRDVPRAEFDRAEVA
jgi:hypothetical protein